MAYVEATTAPLSDLRTASAISIKNVLFATDFSETSEAALPYAAAICRRFGSTLHAAHVLSDASLLMMSGGVDYVSMGTLYDDAHNEAKEKLEGNGARLGSIPHRCHVRHGQVWRGLSAVVEENEVDLIVVGTHGRTGLGKLLLGSVAENILRHAPCPVLTVGPNVSGHARLPALQGTGHDLAPPELDLRQIVLATNLTPNAAGAARTGVRLAEEFRSRLTLLHVVENHLELGTRSGSLESCMRGLHDLVPWDTTLPYVPETQVEYGSAPKDCILKVAAEQQADLIVLGARSREVGRTHLPSTTHFVLAQAHCPVLTVRE